MKKLTIELTNEQSEFLDHVSQLCEKNASDFIKEALVCLLPVNEYIALKKNVVEFNSEDIEQERMNIHDLRRKIHRIDLSTSERLKRIGILQ